MKTKKPKLRFQIRRSDKQFYGRIVGRNGKILAHTETYTQKGNVMKVFNVIFRAASEMDYTVADLTKDE